MQFTLSNDLKNKTLTPHWLLTSPAQKSQNIPSWTGPTWITESNSCLHTRLPKNQTIYLRVLSKCFSNYDRLSAVTISLRSLKCLTILSVKNLFLTASQNLPITALCHSNRTWVLLQVAREQGQRLHF